METRELGKTGHESSVITFGAIALNFLEQDAANEMVEDVLDTGVNHFDVAPTYGDAEVKLAPKLADHRDEVFLGCKTQERTYYGAWGELHRSLDRLGVDTIDLYQFHAVTRYDELEAIQGEYSPEMAQGDHDPGALQAFREAKEEGIIDHIGRTRRGAPVRALTRDDVSPERWRPESRADDPRRRTGVRTDGRIRTGSRERAGSRTRLASPECLIQTIEATVGSSFQQ